MGITNLNDINDNITDFKSEQIKQITDDVEFYMNKYKIVGYLMQGETMLAPPNHHIEGRHPNLSPRAGAVNPYNLDSNYDESGKLVHPKIFGKFSEQNRAQEIVKGVTL